MTPAQEQMTATRWIKAQDVEPGMVLATPIRVATGVTFVRDVFWFDLVIANVVLDPRQCEGFGHPAVHQIDVFSCASDGRIVFSHKILTVGTDVEIMG